MTLTAKGIRQDIVARLTGHMPCGAVVYDSRRINIADDDLPAVCVYTQGSLDSRYSRSSPLFKHTERLVIVGFVTASTDADLAEALDAMSAAIKSTLATDTEFYSAFAGMSGFDESRDYDLSGNGRFASVAIEFAVEYHEDYSQTAEDTPFESVYIAEECVDPEGAGSTLLIEFEE